MELRNSKFLGKAKKKKWKNERTAIRRGEWEMKCKTCGHEIDTPKFIKLKLNGKMVEIESKIHDFGIAFEDVVIPKGMRLLNVKEVIDLQNMPDLIKQIEGVDKGIFIEQWTNQNKRKYCATAWLGCYNYIFDLNADYDLNYRNAARGVLFAKKSAGEKE